MGSARVRMNDKFPLTKIDALNWDSTKLDVRETTTPVEFFNGDTLKKDEFGKNVKIDLKQSSNIAKSNGIWSGMSNEAFSGFCYCLTSISMVLVNKAVLSSFNINVPNCLLFIQCLVSVLLVLLCDFFGILKSEPFDWRVVQVWWPVNIIFIGMLWSGFYALHYLSVPMITMLKNLTNIFTILGDLYFFKKSYPLGVWLSLLLISLSALIGAYTDLSFSVTGYVWQIANCFFTAAYSLFLKMVLTKVANITYKTGGLKDSTKVYYNNLLSLPLVLLLIWQSNEVDLMLKNETAREPLFIIAVVMSGFFGFAVSFCAIKFLSVATPTTYSMVGSLNKVPIAILGWILFNSKTSLQNVLSVLLGLFAGIVFVKSKMN